MAHIVKRETTKGASYHVVYRDPETRKEVWKSAGHRWKDANALKVKIERDQHEGVHVELKEITLGELADKWLREREGQVRPKVLASYRRT